MDLAFPRSQFHSVHVPRDFNPQNPSIQFAILHPRDCLTATPPSRPHPVKTRKTLFQEIEEKAALLRKANAIKGAEFLDGLIRDKDASRFLKQMGPEKSVRFLEGLLELAFPED
jgi:hypothetical protein